MPPKPRNWYPSFTSRVSTHMSQLHTLTQVCNDEEMEAELYHVIDKLLNSTAERRNKKYPHEQGWFLSIGPQPRLNLPAPDHLDFDFLEGNGDEEDGGQEDRGRDQPKVAAPSRVLRSHVDMLEESFTLLSISETSMTSEVSAVSSSNTSEPDPIRNHRTPDFITYLTTEDKTRAIVFIHEVKAFPWTVLRRNSIAQDQAQIAASYRQVFNDMLHQVVEQAQYAFANFDQNILYMMPIVGLKYKIMRFDRNRTPRIGEQLSDDDLPKIPATNHEMDDLLNVSDRDFLNPNFQNFNAVDLKRATKRWWTVAIKKALEAVDGG